MSFWRRIIERWKPEPPPSIVPPEPPKTAVRFDLRACMPHASAANVRKYEPHLQRAAAEHGIEAPLDLAHWLGQIAHESGSLAVVEENLNYSAEALRRVFPKYFAPGEEFAFARKPQKIANRVYANRNGNGDERSGDGWLHRGFGTMQATGKANHAAWAEDASRRHLLEDHGYTVGAIMDAPSLIAVVPAFAADVAGWFWRVNRVSRWALLDDVRAVSGIVNAGNPRATRINGLDDRMARTIEAKKGVGLL